jgi:hypothetical protein
LNRARQRKADGEGGDDDPVLPVGHEHEGLLVVMN